MDLRECALGPKLLTQKVPCFLPSQMPVMRNEHRPLGFPQEKKGFDIMVFAVIRFKIKC
jgi:hypothetical protein